MNNKRSIFRKIKLRWLSTIIHFTNRIYLIKQKILYSNAFASLLSCFLLFFYEVLLSLISLPLYIFIKPGKLIDKKEYMPIVYDTNFYIRRNLTLGSLVVFTCYLFIKIVIVYILSFPYLSELGVTSN